MCIFGALCWGTLNEAVYREWCGLSWMDGQLQYRVQATTEHTKVQVDAIFFVEIRTRIYTLTLRTNIVNTSQSTRMWLYSRLRGLSCKRNREKSILTFILCDRFPFCRGTKSRLTSRNGARKVTWSPKIDQVAQILRRRVADAAIFGLFIWRICQWSTCRLCASNIKDKMTVRCFYTKLKENDLRFWNQVAWTFWKKIFYFLIPIFFFAFVSATKFSDIIFVLIWCRFITRPVS